MAPELIVERLGALVLSLLPLEQPLKSAPAAAQATRLARIQLNFVVVLTLDT